MSDNYDNLCDKLWEITNEDWSIWMANTLTEPVCYEVTIQPESADSIYTGVDSFYGTGCPRESAINALNYVLKAIQEAAT